MITVADNSGFCFGVLNAVNKTTEILKSNDRVYALGELVHNKAVVSKLENLGLITVSSLKEIPNGSQVIVRAHGVGPDIIKKAHGKHLKVYDLTCPKVKKVHDLVMENNKNFIIIIGIKTHPEIIGTTGYAKDYYVVESENDIVGLKEAIKNYNGVINIYSQTTFSVTKFNELIALIKKNIPNTINAVSCICPSTDIRQEEVTKLSKGNDLVIVVGGKNSSNTEKLYKIASSITSTIWVENKNEIDKNIIKKYDKIALVSGASTSKEDVNDIYSKLINNDD